MDNNEIICPHCGAILNHIRGDEGGRFWHIHCDECGARGPLGKTAQEAIDKWLVYEKRYEQARRS